MTAGSPPPSSPAGPPSEPGADVASTQVGRPSWGSIDVVVATMVWLGAVIVGTGLALLTITLTGFDLVDGADLPIYAVFASMVVLTTAQFVCPWLVSRRKGLGMVSDWGFRFRLPQDVGYGFVLAIICVFAALAAQRVMAAIVGLEDLSEASNTALLTDNEDSPWLIGVMIFVVIGAPLTEELFFRGLIMRAFLKDFGPAIAVVGSTLLFTAPHLVDGGSIDEQLVLWAAISAIGLVLSLAALRFDRLGPSMIAHFFFNLFSAATTLWG